MGEIVNYTTERKGTYAEYREALRTELERASESFVRIGYLLRLAEDTDILAESGYSDVRAFALAEFGLDESAVSRFKDINRAFSEGGYSERLAEKYRGYGHSKLAILMLLPASLQEEVSPEYSKRDITAIKKEVDAENRVTDLERMLEPENEDQRQMETNLEKVLHQIGQDHFELFEKMWQAAKAGIYDSPEDGKELLFDAFAPAGEGMHFARIPGTGRLALSVKGLDQDVTLTNVRTGEKESYSWDELLKAVGDVICVGENPKKGWQIVYQSELPENEEIAPVQRKPAKVTVAKNEKTEEPRMQEQEEDLPAAGAVVPEEINIHERPPQTGPKKESTTWKEPKQKEHKPVELPPADASYTVPIGITLLGEIIKGGQRFLIIKETSPYRVGNILHLEEHQNGEITGMVRDVKITHMEKDHGGITPGYCVLQIELLPPVEEQLPGQLSMEEMINEPENQDEA